MKIIPESGNCIDIETEKGLTLQISEDTLDNEIRITGFYHGHTIVVFNDNFSEKEKLLETFGITIKNGRPKEEAYNKEGNYIDELKKQPSPLIRLE